MGSVSDAASMEGAKTILTEFGVPCETKVLSAHRTPDETADYVRRAASSGIEVFIAGAGGAAHLAGTVAALSVLPVIGVPMQSKLLGGLDSLLSTVQMPVGVPVATVAVDGAENAGLLAIRILALKYSSLSSKLLEYRGSMRDKILNIKI